jgi:hypothetical protein
MQTLQRKEEERSIALLKNKHASERLQAQDAHALEFQELSSSWEERLYKLHMQGAEMLESLAEKHGQERAQLVAQLIQVTFLSKPKPSSELLNYRKILEVLVKRKDYGEAAKVQRRVDSLEATEQLKWDQASKKKMQLAEAQLIRRQELEFRALKRRLQAAEDEHTKWRALEHEKLLQKYQNILKGLESEQNLELIYRSSPHTSRLSV